jgi:hypothetical protein
LFFDLRGLLIHVGFLLLLLLLRCILVLRWLRLRVLGVLSPLAVSIKAVGGGIGDLGVGFEF